MAGEEPVVVVSSVASDTTEQPGFVSSTASEADNKDDEEDDDSESSAPLILPSTNLLVEGALLGLELLPEGTADPRQRVGTSKLGISKKSWTKVEDAVLTEIVEKNGAARWSTIATQLPGRAGKQCRERWFNVSTKSAPAPAPPTIPPTEEPTFLPL